MGKLVTMIKINVPDALVIDDIAKFLGHDGLIQKKAGKTLSEPPLVFEKRDSDYRKEALQIREYLLTLGEITNNVYNNQKQVSSDK